MASGTGNGPALCSGSQRLIGGVLDNLRCSFCGKPGGTGVRLVAGPGVLICAECVGLCSEILAQDPPAAAAEADPGL
jgi:hypothetical protein